MYKLLKDIILNTYNDGENYEETIKLLYDLYPKIVDLNEYNQKRKKFLLFLHGNNVRISFATREYYL